MNYVIKPAKNRYCFFLATSTILNGYSAWIISGFSIGMMVCSIYAVMGIIFLCLGIRSYNTNVNYKPIILVLCLVILSLFSISITSSSQIKLSDIVWDVLKLLVWAFCIIAGRFYFDNQLFKKWIYRIAILATIYIIMQYILSYVFHVTLPNTINLGIIKPNSDLYNYTLSIGNTYFRPGSFWQEPAYYGYYMVCALILCLFTDNSGIVKNNKRLALFFSLGIILSTTTGGIYSMILVWLFYLLIRRKNKFLSFCAVVIIIMIGALTLSSDIISNIANSIDDFGVFGKTLAASLDKVSYMQSSGRVGESFALVNNLYGIYKYIGVGIGNELAFMAAITTDSYSYMNSLTMIIVWTGYIGLFVFAIYAISMFRSIELKHYAGIMFFIYLLGGIYSGIYFSIHAIIYMTIIIYSDYKSNL